MYLLHSPFDACDLLRFDAAGSDVRKLCTFDTATRAETFAAEIRDRFGLPYLAIHLNDLMVIVSVVRSPPNLMDELRRLSEPQLQRAVT